MRGAPVDDEVVDVHAVEFGHPERSVEHVEERAVERRALAVARLVELGDQACERQVLIGEGIERGAFDPPDQLEERRLPGGVRPEHERVDERGDEALALEPVPVRDRGADGDVVRRREPTQEQLVRREQHHVRRHLLVAAELFEQRPEVAGERRRDRGTGGGQHRRPRTIGGELGDLEPGELVPPVLELMIENVAVDQLTVPARVVDGAGTRRRQVDGNAVERSLVAGRDLMGHQVERPLVGDDVVHRDQRTVIVVVEPEEDEPHERERIEPERLVVLP